MRRAALLALLALAACSNEDDRRVLPPIHARDAGAAEASVTPDAGPLRGFVPPEDPGAGGLLVTASGEALALGGYPFPPASANDTAFVDGWKVDFDRVLVTVDHLRLSSNPDMAPGDPTLTGPVVARLDGPWAIDLHKDDPSYLPGKGGGRERAVPIAAFRTQNQAGDAPFPTDGTRFAFGFDVVPATTAAFDVNLGPEALADYEAMAAEGCTVLYAGTATFAGQGCATDPELARLPPVVRFRFCFKSPTAYDNCQNPDNDPAAPFPSEEHARGVAFKANASVVAQVTIHTDHPFWESTEHDQPAHFDPFAARAVGRGDGGVPLVTLDDVRGVDFTAFTDALGNPLPWRSCLSTYTPPSMGQMSFDPHGVPIQPPNGDPSRGLRDFFDFATYDQSTQGHLDADGLCAVRRGYPSPP